MMSQNALSEVNGAFFPASANPAATSFDIGRLDKILECHNHLRDVIQSQQSAVIENRKRVYRGVR